MKILNLILFSILFLFFSTSSIAEDSSFFKKYTSSLSTCGYALAVSSNEEIGMAGLRYDTSEVRTSFFAGANKLGDLEFVNSYVTDSTTDTLSVMSSTPDGGFILAGTTKAPNEKRTILIYKVRSNGTIVWKKRIRSTEGGDVIWGMAPTPTGNILAGTTSALDVLLLKINWQTGKILWKKTYGDEAAEYGYSVSATEDGGALIVGVRDDNPLVLKIDRAGNLLWHRVIASAVDSGDGAPIVATTPNAYYIGSTTTGADHSHGALAGIVVTKITPQGKFVWSRHYHNSAESLIGWHLIPAEDGGVILSGQLGTNPAIFLRIDPAGKVRWKRMLTETNSAAFFSDALGDNHILITGCVGQSTLELFTLKINQKNGLLDSSCNVLKSPAIISGSRSQKLATYSIAIKNPSILTSIPAVTRNELAVAVREGCLATQ